MEALNDKPSTLVNIAMCDGVAAIAKFATEIEEMARNFDGDIVPIISVGGAASHILAWIDSIEKKDDAPSPRPELARLKQNLENLLRSIVETLELAKNG